MDHFGQVVIEATRTLRQGEGICEESTLRPLSQVWLRISQQDSIDNENNRTSKPSCPSVLRTAQKFDHRVMVGEGGGSKLCHLLIPGLGENS